MFLIWCFLKNVLPNPIPLRRAPSRRGEVSREMLDTRFCPFKEVRALVGMRKTENAEFPKLTKWGSNTC